MRRKFLSMVLGVAVVFSVLSPLATPTPASAASFVSEVLADNPAAYWRLGEMVGTIAEDSSTSGNNDGTYTGGPTLDVAGALTNSSNAAVLFDGVNDYVQVADSPSLSPASVSVEAWVYLHSYSGLYPRIISKVGSYELVMYTYAGGEGRLEWKLFTGPSPGTPSNTIAAYSNRLLLNQWYHVVATYDGAMSRIYVNSSEVASKVTTGDLVDNAAAVRLANNEGTRYVNATLDEVAIYSTALSPTRITAHYAARNEEEPPAGYCLGVEAYPEIRPSNTHWNNIPAEPLNPAYREHIEGFGPYYDQVDGLGCLGGTTEQILEWAAIKWGLDDIPGFGPNIVKAVAVKESDWYARVQGDFESCTQSWCFPSPGYYGTTFQTTGITGVKRTAWPDSADAHISTAFAADYYAAALRAYYDGAIPWASGTQGNVTLAIAAWFCGCDTGFPDYTDDVFDFLANETWKTETFKTGTACSTNCAP